jgi:hypothetical protein
LTIIPILHGFESSHREEGMMVKKIKIDRVYYLLAAMILAGALLTAIFISIFRKLFHMPTWQSIKGVLEVFRYMVL